jgi:hypothetical protein
MSTLGGNVVIRNGNEQLADYGGDHPAVAKQWLKERGHLC